MGAAIHLITMSPAFAIARARKLIAFMAVALCAWTNTAHAHAFGERYDLPVPLWLNLIGAGAVVVVSFVIAAWFLRPSAGGERLRRVNLLHVPWLRTVTGAVTVRTLRFASVLLFALALIAGFIGEPVFARNAAPTIVWVLGWVGLSFFSALVGNIWVLVNPWLILFEWAEALRRRLTGSGGLSLDLAYPKRFGVAPGIVLLIGIVWFMLASRQAGEPIAIARVLTIYSAVTWIGMVLFGPATWLARGEAFTLIATVLSRFSPVALRVTDPGICARAGCAAKKVGGGCSDCVEAFYRAPREAREVNLRPYGAGLVPPQPLSMSMTVVVIIVLSMAGFEGFMDTSKWADVMIALGELEMDDGFHAPGLTVLLFIAFSALLYMMFYVVSALMKRLGSSHVTAGAKAPHWTTTEMVGLFVLSLVPIALAYHIAHYLYWFTTSIQYLIPAASDPLGWGWNLFGTRDYVPNRTAVSLAVIWHTAVVAIVAGHVVAVYAAHRTALIAFGTRRAAFWSQIPMLVLMVIYTMSSLWMIAQPIMG